MMFPDARQTTTPNEWLTCYKSMSVSIGARVSKLIICCHPQKLESRIDEEETKLCMGQHKNIQHLHVAQLVCIPV